MHVRRVVKIFKDEWYNISIVWSGHWPLRDGRLAHQKHEQLSQGAIFPPKDDLFVRKSESIFFTNNCYRSANFLTNELVLSVHSDWPTVLFVVTPVWFSVDGNQVILSNISRSSKSMYYFQYFGYIGYISVYSTYSRFSCVKRSGYQTYPSLPTIWYYHWSRNDAINGTLEDFSRSKLNWKLGFWIDVWCVPIRARHIMVKLCKCLCYRAALEGKKS